MYNTENNNEKKSKMVTILQVFGKGWLKWLALCQVQKG